MVAYTGWVSSAIYKCMHQNIYLVYIYIYIHAVVIVLCMLVYVNSNKRTALYEHWRPKKVNCTRNYSEAFAMILSIFGVYS